jgi:16S rRNA (uracil1498-N3)-methyltransferase
MPISRIFQPVTLAEGADIELDEAASHHLARVLRAALQDRVTVFNGQGGEYHGLISRIDKKRVTLTLTEYSARDAESPLSLCLAQGISRGEKMDYTIQKAVELGVRQIIPLLTERCNVKLDEDRKQKRLQHWQSIVISACEQSGRTFVPEVLSPQTLTSWLQATDINQGFIVSPHVKNKLSAAPIKKNFPVALLIGPEGGLSATEVSQAHEIKGFMPLNLGPRILRTETAAVAAITALQCYFGDLGAE